MSLFSVFPHKKFSIVLWLIFELIEQKVMKKTVSTIFGREREKSMWQSSIRKSFEEIVIGYTNDC